MSAQNDPFPSHVLQSLEGLFEDGRIQTKIRFTGMEPPFDPSVMIVDSKTGQEILEDRFPSQIQNKSAALLRLLENK